MTEPTIVELLARYARVEAELKVLDAFDFERGCLPFDMTRGRRAAKLRELEAELDKLRRDVRTEALVDGKDEPLGASLEDVDAAWWADVRRRLGRNHVNREVATALIRAGKALRLFEPADRVRGYIGDRPMTNAGASRSRAARRTPR